jgi:hypothetical protein
MIKGFLIGVWKVRRGLKKGYLDRKVECRVWRLKELLAL